ncbi:MAG: 4-alpha-glucanotransferase [Peptococcaceae bacterium]|nr:4-alpha-glucanotransferase [Peptococcaceae bacterium]
MLVNRSEAGLKYVLGGVGVEGSGFSRPVWSRPPDWDGAVHSWEIVDLDSGGCEGIWDLAQVSLSVDVPALSARVLLFRGARATAKPPWLNRVAGVLLPVASLPSRYGVGDFGGAAYRFVDVLVEAGQKVWQLLPLNPPDHVHSPYQSAGAMAISSLYIDPEQLTAVLRKAFPELAEMVSRVVDGTDDGLMWEPTMARIDYAQAKRLKARVLQRAFAVWSLGREGRLDGCEDRLDQSVGLLQAYDEFCEVNAYWLEDYALFCALKNEQEGSVWQLWDEGLRGREEKALAAARLRLQAEVEAVLFEQFIVHKQFEALRGYANERGLLIMGDVPFYVAADSADCWAHQEMFWLREGVPTLVAGVPPDAFAEDGQRWGNPLYRWDVMETDGFSWWCDRMRRGFALFDFVRLDHFRGFAAYWEIPAHREDAREGQWVKGPGRFFFEVLRRELGEKAQGIVAEDLGFWTPEVKILRELAGVPGMRVLQFEDGNTDIEEDTVFFSGTHDNGTLYQWMVDRDSNKTDVFPSADNVSGADGPEGRESERCRSSCRELVESMYSSRAGLIILPVQDVLLLDERARINVPGTDQGNWAWRMEEAAMSDSAWQWLGELARRTGRGSNQIRF